MYFKIVHIVNTIDFVVYYKINANTMVVGSTGVVDRARAVAMAMVGGGFCCTIRSETQTDGNRKNKRVPFAPSPK